MTTSASEPGVDVRTERLQVGEGEIRLLRAGSGPPLLFLHAAGGGGWTPFLDGCSAAASTSWPPTIPGFGGSEQTDEMEAMDDLVYHYLDVLDQLGIERVGRRRRVARRLDGGGARGPLAASGSARLVLLSAAGLRMPDAPGRRPVHHDARSRSSPTLFHDPAAAGGMFPAEPDVDFILRDLPRQHGASRATPGAPFLNNPKLERRLHRITAPTLVLWADDDRVIPHRARASGTPSGSRRARCEIIEDCGHAMYFERPEAFADAVARLPANGGRR